MEIKIDSDTASQIVVDELNAMYHEIKDTEVPHKEDKLYNKKLLKALKRVHNYYTLPDDHI